MRRRRPASGSRPPCSDLLEREAGHRAPAVRQLPEPAAVGAVRLQAGPAARRLRHRRASLASGIDGSGRDGGHRRRLRLADDRQRRHHLRPAQRPDATRSRSRSSRQKATARSTTAARTSATRRAGTARRRSTSRPCTRWPPAPTSATSARKSCHDADLIAALNDLVDGHKADIVSNSYGNLGEDVTGGRRGRHASASSRRPRSRASASTSPPVTTATRATPATAARSRRPTSRPPRRS